MYPLLCALVLLTVLPGHAQHLRPGFDKAEFMEMLRIGARTTTLPAMASFPAPQRFRMVYQSPEIGMDNLWQLWISADSVAVISIRGTIPTQTSFMANFYAAMLPARGTLRLDKDFRFPYALSDDPAAAVHTGYLISTAYLSRDILPRLDSCYRQGIREFIIAGHSQGGAITYLLTAYLRSLIASGALPGDIRLKTCSSAAPKPGNLPFAYSYEHLTGDWAYNVVSTADWVPEVPFSIQTVNDMSEVNPFRDAGSIIRKQGFPTGWVMGHIYGQLRRPPLRAQRRYEKFLGKKFRRRLRRSWPYFEAPPFAHTSHYVRTGRSVVLYADSAYYAHFPPNPDKIWEHHSQQAYMFLVQRLPAAEDLP